MPDAPDRLTEAALRPLAADAEQRLAGSRLLDGVLQASHPGAAAMLARWDALDGGKRRSLWRPALLVALVVLSAWAWVDTLQEGMWYKRTLGLLGIGTVVGIPVEPHEVIGKGLSERNKFLLFGDLSRKSESERMRALWDSAPDNPAYFAEYALTYRSDHGGYPPVFLATARRLDPANSWFTYHAAADLAHNAVRKDRQSVQARKAGDAPTWQILDAAKLDQALALLREASTQQNFVNRHKELVTARLPLLPQDNQISRVASLCHVSGYLFPDFPLRYLSEAVAARAWLLGEAGDTAGFRQLLGDAEAFIAACGGMNQPTLVDVLMFKSNAALVVVNLHAAAGKLGLEPEAARLGRLKGRLEQWSAEQKHRGQGEPLALRSSMLAGSIDAVRNLVKSPPPLADADLKPGRMIEHLMVARLGSLAVWAVLGVGLLAIAVYRYCLPAWLLQLAQRMNSLLLPSDWAWMLGAGVLLPFGYVTVLMRCTALGGQDWGLRATGVILPAAQFLALALLLLAVPALLARWRLVRRAAALGMGGGTPVVGWLAVAVGLAFVPVLGLSAPLWLEQCGLGRIAWNFKDHWCSWRSALLVPLLLGIGFSVVRALAVTFTRQFPSAVVALALIPAYACGMLLVMVSMPVYKAAQSCWERHDPMTELATNGLTRYEGAVATQLLQEVRQVLELDGHHAPQ